MSEDIMICDSGKGFEIFEYLKRELNIPTSTKSFSVKFEANMPVIVECVYFPENK
jgi:hypothetical protein